MVPILLLVMIIVIAGGTVVCLRERQQVRDILEAIEAERESLDGPELLQTAKLMSHEATGKLVVEACLFVVFAASMLIYWFPAYTETGRSSLRVAVIIAAMTGPLTSWRTRSDRQALAALAQLRRRLERQDRKPPHATADPS